MAKPNLKNMMADNFKEAIKPDEEFKVEIPKDVENVGVQEFNAPTSNPSRPRALTVAYNPTTATLVVVFRDNTWWQYNNVPVELWQGLTRTESTGRYLRASGLDTWPDMGPANTEALSESTREKISYSASIASRIQAGKAITYDEVYFPKG
jgi:hypothetical protein